MIKRKQAKKLLSSIPLIIKIHIICWTDLEVIGEFGAAGVARVHGDEDGAGGVQADLGAFKQQAVRARRDTWWWQGEDGQVWGMASYLWKIPDLKASVLTVDILQAQR